MNQQFSFDRVEAGRALGHDFRRWSGIARDSWPAPVREGFAAARAAGVLPKPADRYIRKWLQLRESALRRERVMADDVTPELLRQIDVGRCPVTRVVLTHSELSDSDWSIDRINNDGAYAANNLAVMSVRANRAKGARNFEEVYALARAEASDVELSSAEWLRMAALMLGPCCIASPVTAPVLPLAAPIPSHSVRPGYQQIQHVFTLGARRQAGKNALVKEFKVASGSERALARLRLFAEANHQGLKGLEHAHDVWLRPDVMDAFVAWRDSLDEQSRLLAGQISGRLAGGKTVSAACIASWRLESRGYCSQEAA